METTINLGDRIIAISEDDDTLLISANPGSLDEAAMVTSANTKDPQPEHTLILGWNPKAPLMLRELDKYVTTGSKLACVAEFADGIEACKKLCPATARLEVSFFKGDTTDRTVLNALDIPSFDQVILLSPESEDNLDDDQRADSRTLITLLHLRDIREQSGSKFSIISEMRDPRNRALAEVTLADDFIIGDELVSLLLSQISENKELSAVFDDLLDPEGSEIYIKPASDYILPGQAINFYTVLESARRRGQIAIGYRQQRFASSKGRAFGIVINPLKSSRMTFEPNDSVIVISED
jgi:hypothetical protein